MHSSFERLGRKTRLGSRPFLLFLGARALMATSCETQFVLEPVPVVAGCAIPDFYQIQMLIGGTRQPVMVDSGSVYLFLGSANNEPALECSDPFTFTYGIGAASYCPTFHQDVLAETRSDQGAPFPVATPQRSLQYGVARFDQAFGGPPFAIIGLSSDLNRAKTWPMDSVIRQLQFPALSFEFPQGPAQPGVMSFCPIERDEASARIQIPLTDPGALDYGYVAALERMEFYRDERDSDPAVILVQRPDGVVLEDTSTGKSSRVASHLRGFFDTGTTDPFGGIFIGDISLMGGQVARSALPTPPGAPRTDRIDLVVRDANGKEARLTHSLRQYNDLNVRLQRPVITAPVAEAFPPQLDSAVALIGLNWLAHYDFEFRFNEQQLPFQLNLFPRQDAANLWSCPPADSQSGS